MSFRRCVYGDYEAKYGDWVERVTRMHQDFAPYLNDPVAWAPARKPLAECRVALVTTAGVHCRADMPFDQLAAEGDPSYREIGADDSAATLAVSHNHFDHSAADRDVNCLFPIDRLRELAAAGVIESVSPVHFGFMGFNPDPYPVLESGAEVAQRLAEARVDVAVLTPG